VTQKMATQDETSHQTTEHGRGYLRFMRSQRIEHIILLLSFTVLAITGLPQKYSTAPISIWAIDVMGGIETVRIIHRISAILLMVLTIYHFLAVFYRVYVKRVALTMLPGWQDVLDAIQALGYNLRLLRLAPRMGRYTFAEKAEYWAVIWGTVVMVITGFVLWNPIATTHFLPGQFIPAAKAAHGGEAVLAVLSILTWHVWHVHIKHFNRSMFTGFISRHEMETEHQLELAAIEAGEQAPPPNTDAQRRRMRRFMPIAAVITVMLVVGLYFFITFEKTAITTVPRQEVEVFTPAE
jgi:cytochrome b subunit of formate dehydrogenase